MSFEVKYPRLELIVACDQNLGIGKDGTLPWSLPSEFAYYLRMAQNNRQNSEGKVHVSIFGWANGLTGSRSPKRSAIKIHGRTRSALSLVRWRRRNIK